MEGNTHTGAPLPWFDATIGDQLDPTKKPELRHLGFSKAGKSKLNLKRVGVTWAERRKLELEMEGEGNLLVIVMMLIGSLILVDAILVSEHALVENLQFILKL